MGTNWLTSYEHLMASSASLTLAEDFMLNKQMHGEEIWEEIWIDGKAFDVNIWEEDFNPEGDGRTSPVHASLYPTIEKDNGYIETDVNLCERLFTLDHKDQ